MWHIFLPASRISVSNVRCACTVTSTCSGIFHAISILPSGKTIPRTEPACSFFGSAGRIDKASFCLQNIISWMALTVPKTASSWTGGLPQGRVIPMPRQSFAMVKRESRSTLFAMISSHSAAFSPSATLIPLTPEAARFVERTKLSLNLTALPLDAPKITL